MENILVDAGPLIALFDKGDKFHDPIVRFLKIRKEILITTWPVLTEVCHMLDFNVAAQLNFLEWIRRDGLEIRDIDISSLPGIIEMTRRYRDLPMDLADATLIIVAEKTGIRNIITIDNDFDIYRTAKKEIIQNVFNLSEYGG